MATINSVNNSTFSSASAITITSGNLVVSSGNITLPNTTTTPTGIIQWNSVNTIHNYGTRNFMAGPLAGNTTLTTGSATDNVFLGYNAGNGITSGTSNSICGSQAFAVASSASYCTALGYNALNALTTATGGNIAVGSGALSALLTGSYNISVGYNSGSNYTGSESSNILIGHAGVAAESNVMRLGTDGSGNGQISSTYIAGVYNSTVTGSAVLISSTFQLGLVASSIRYKENVQDMGETNIMKLRPVTFNYNFGTPEDQAKIQYGLIAEEVLEVMPELVAYNDKGEVHTVHYHILPSLLLNELQKQQKVIDHLEDILEKLEAKNV